MREIALDVIKDIQNIRINNITPNKIVYEITGSEYIALANSIHITKDLKLRQNSIKFKRLYRLEDSDKYILQYSVGSDDII